MKKLLTLILTLTLAASLLSGCGPKVVEANPKVIAVVAKGEESAFWRAVLAGAEDAANDYGYAITFRGPSSEDPRNVDEQLALVDLALENQVLGLAVSAIGPGFGDRLLEAQERGIPVVQFDSGLWTEDLEIFEDLTGPVVSSVFTGNMQAGAISAEHLFEAVRESIAAFPGQYLIGIIQHDLSNTGAERAEGFRRKFQELADADPMTVGKYTIETVINTGVTDDAYGKDLEEFQTKGVKALFMTSEQVVNQVYDRVQDDPERYRDVLFTGFDAGVRQIRWMRRRDLPQLIGSVTQDAYGVGYRAVEQCILCLESREVTGFVSIPGAWYDRENLDRMIARSLVEE